MTLFTVNFQVYFLMSYKVCFGHQSEWIYELSTVCFCCDMSWSDGNIKNEAESQK